MRVRDKVYNRDAAGKVKRDLTLLYHIVEKGLTMPEPRPGFGKKVVADLCNVIMKYHRMHLPVDALEFVQAVSSLHEYDEFHHSIGFDYEPDLKASLQKVLALYPDVRGEEQISTTADAYFAGIRAPFDEFCNSRFSVRNYTDMEIPVSVLMDCIQLAQKSPSFCNRQPTRVNIVKSPEKKKAILEIQNGNRGFGHLAETLLVLTSDITTTKDIHERFENHLNGGMFAMTLLNALHFNKIAACSLNWSVSPDKDRIMRKILNVPENEVVLLVISCGYPPETFRMASSPRKNASEITTTHL
jgi:nitroreductase